MVGEVEIAFTGGFYFITGHGVHHQGHLGIFGDADAEIHVVGRRLVGYRCLDSVAKFAHYFGRIIVFCRCLKSVGSYIAEVQEGVRLGVESVG